MNCFHQLINKRAVLYARVSKDDGSQTCDNQLQSLRDYAKAYSLEVVREYIDYGSGSGVSDRGNFLQMLQDAEKRQFDVVLISALDRLSREGIPNTLGYLRRLSKCNVAVKSLSEAWLDTQAEGVGELLIAIFSWVAAQERKRIIERINAGLARARTEGKRLGRPLGAKDKDARSRSGYHLRYSGKSKEERRLGKREEEK